MGSTEWTEESLVERELTEREKDLRRRFVDEYMHDHNSVKAVIRIGFGESFATEYAKRFMTEPFVLRLIRERETETSKDNDIWSDPNRIATVIKNKILKEADFNGIGASHAARVTALRTLVEVLGLRAPTKSEVDVNMRGGVMMVPGIASLEDWERSAQQEQVDLMRKTQT